MALVSISYDSVSIVPLTEIFPDNSSTNNSPLFDRFVGRFSVTTAFVSPAFGTVKVTVQDDIPAVVPVFVLVNVTVSPPGLTVP